MSEEQKPATPSKGTPGLNSQNPESPTTARPLDFDDEPQETGVTTVSPSTGAQQTAGEAAPPKPARPLSPQQQAENTLKEAFPSIDAGVVRAVLVASGWNVEQAFHGLLAMTDPTAQEEIAPPKPPRPSQPATSTARSQLEADELYARQLAEHYNSGSRRSAQAGYQRPRGPSDQSEDKEYSFFDDDLPVIRDNIRKGFLETQSKVNTWVQNFKKRLDGDDLDDIRASQNYSGGQAAYHRPRGSGEMGRRSGDRERYDADPRVLGDDFSALELRDSEVPPPRPPRPLANPDLYNTSASAPDRRKVAFQNASAADADDLYDDSQPASRSTGGGGGGKSSKWQPLSTVEPSPVVENDPFSLGDSEDERETKAKDQPADDAERIKKATAEAMSGGLDDGKKDSAAK